MNVSQSEGKFIVDSYGWIEYFSGGRLAERYSKYIERSTPDTSITPSIIVYEVYKKLRASYGEEEATKAVAHIEHYTKIVDADMNLAMKGAEASLAEELPMADAIIRGAARMHNAVIVTSDRHFKGKDGVVFIE